jgi:hypothetical protein
MGVRAPKTEELAIINKSFAKRELKAEEVYVLDNISAANNKTMTSYFSFLGDDMIQAFHANVNARAENSKAPIIGYMFGHKHAEIPSGTLFKSELSEVPIEGSDQKALHFKPSVFMLKNLNVAGLNTDDYVKAYEGGLTEDVSVSFIAGSGICDLCGRDIRNWDCEHIPGRFYNTATEGETPVMKLATYTLHQGFFKELNLAELSGVYRGALRGARIEDGSSLSVKDAGKDGGFMQVGKDGVAKPTGKEVLSRNIKDFMPTDVLRFNYAGDGMIELVGRISEDEKKKADDSQAVALAAQVKDLLAEVSREQEKNKTVQAAFTAMEKELGDLKEAHKATTRVLALSEVDKVDLQTKLAEAKVQITDLEVKNTANEKLAQEYVAALKAECEKLAVGINGMAHNPEIFGKELGALSVEEMKTKKDVLQKQFAQMFPTGRKSEAPGNVFKVDDGKEARPVADRPELYKIK